MTTDFMEARDVAEKLPYSIYSIQYRYLKHKTIGDQGSVIEIYYFDNNNDEYEYESEKAFYLRRLYNHPDCHDKAHPGCRECELEFYWDITDD